MGNYRRKAAAQHGHGADAATRRQDRGDFEGRNRLESFPDLVGRRG
jgi:hypothetical protein